jgi:hypothetical protein
MSELHNDNLLPKDIKGRVACALASAVLLPLSGICLWPLTFGPLNPAMPWFVCAALWELFAAMMGVGACLLIWAIATPAWLPPIAHRWAGRLALLLLVPFLILIGMTLWP